MSDLEDDTKKPEEVLSPEEIRRRKPRQLAIRLYTLGRWENSALSGILTLYHFFLFLFLVISMSLKEGKDGDQCGDTVRNCIAVCIGLRFTQFAWNGSKFLLVIFGSIDPNSLSMIDSFLLIVEGLFGIWVIAVMGSEGSDCSDAVGLVYVCLIFCVLNTIVIWLKCCLWGGCCVLLFVWLFTKQLPFDKLGGSISCLKQFFDKHEEEKKPKEDEEE